MMVFLYTKYLNGCVRVLAGSALLLLAASSSASPADAITLFEAMCIATEGDVKVIERMALAAGGQEIPPKMMRADRAVAEFGGKGFILERNGKRYSVAATPNRACSVIAQDVQATEVRRLLLVNYPLTLPQSDSSGLQVVTMWRVGAPSRLEGAAVTLNAVKPGFDVDNAVSLGYMPASAAKKLGLFGGGANPSSADQLKR